MEGNKPKVRRPIEREYLSVLSDEVPLETWRSVCQRAVADALNGDAKAREWLAKWFLDMDSQQMTALAARESGPEPATAEAEIAALWQKIEADRQQTDFNSLQRQLQFPAKRS